MTTGTVTVYTAEQVAQLLGCSVKTVQQLARDGDLPGLLLGDGGWVFPAGALHLRLDELALQQAASRRKAPEPAATTAPAPPAPVKQPARRGPRPLPKLVKLDTAGAAT